MPQTCIHNATVVAGYALMPESAVLVEGDTIADLFSERRFRQKHFSSDVSFIDAQGAYLVPGLIDSHIHGFAGFGTEDLSTDSILAMSKVLAAYGVTTFCPTLYPMSEQDMIAGIRAIIAAMGLEPGSKIAGIHLEGPFISSAKLGVQRAEFARSVDVVTYEFENVPAL